MSANIDRDDVLAAMRGIELFKSVPTDAIRTERLGGLTNRNFRIDSPLGRHVLRIPGAGTSEYINRHNEAHAAKSAAQVGVTLAGFFSAAFGGATLAGRLAPTFEDWGMSHGAAEASALVVITVAISYVSLVIGELTPKRLARQRSESIALAVAPTVDRIAKIARPVIWLLSVSTNRRNIFPCPSRRA